MAAAKRIIAATTEATIAAIRAPLEIPVLGSGEGAGEGDGDGGVGEGEGLGEGSSSSDPSETAAQIITEIPAITPPIAIRRRIFSKSVALVSIGTSSLPYLAKRGSGRNRLITRLNDMAILVSSVA